MARNVTVWGRPGKPPPSPLPLRQIIIPPLKLQRPAFWSFSRGLDLGLSFGVPCAAPFSGEPAWSKASVPRSLLREQKGLAFVSWKPGDQGVSGRQSPSHGHFLVAWWPKPEAACLGPNTLPLAGDHPGAPAVPYPISPTSERNIGVRSDEVGWKEQGVLPGSQVGLWKEPLWWKHVVLSFCFEVDWTGEDRERPAM